MRAYYVYILTNKAKTVLYTGVTNNLELRLSQHQESTVLNKPTFTGRYKCCYLLYFETHQNVNDAIAREKQIKGWSRAKKVELIKSTNHKMDFLNE